MATIVVPRALVEKAKELGVDIESTVVNALVQAVNLDPIEEAEVHLELAEIYLKEAEAYLKKGDSIQASEKMYKAAEEAIKALASAYRTPEREKASKDGRWRAHLLGKAARRLSAQLNEPRIASTWSRAFDIHTWGFHEAKYSTEDIKGDLAHIKWIVKYAQEKLQAT